MNLVKRILLIILAVINIASALVGTALTLAFVLEFILYSAWFIFGAEVGPLLGILYGATYTVGTVAIGVTLLGLSVLLTQFIGYVADD